MTQKYEKTWLYPKIEISFQFIKEIDKKQSNILNGNIQTYFTLLVTATNHGSVFAKYCNASLEIPKKIVSQRSWVQGKIEQTYLKVRRNNFHSENNSFTPILPKLSLSWKIVLRDYFIRDESIIRWTVSADAAPMNSGAIMINAIPNIKAN